MRKKTRKEIEPRKSLAVSVTVTGDRNATAACASMLGGHYTKELIQAAGTAKRMYGDPYHPEIGSDLAVGRALVKLGWELIRRGETRVQLEAETKVAEKLLAGMNRTARALRRTGPHPGLMSLDEVHTEYGMEAAQRAARRRGGQSVSTQETQSQEVRHRRDNGLPTIETDTEKEKS